MEGDAMLHGVWLEGGTARYRNRFVRTKGFVAEAQAGRPLYGGLMTPSFVDPALLGPDPDPAGPFDSIPSSTSSATGRAISLWAKASHPMRSPKISAPWAFSTSVAPSAPG